MTTPLRLPTRTELHHVQQTLNTAMQARVADIDTELDNADQE